MHLQGSSCGRYLPLIINTTLTIEIMLLHLLPISSTSIAILHPDLHPLLKADISHGLRESRPSEDFPSCLGHELGLGFLVRFKELDHREGHCLLGGGPFFATRRASWGGVGVVGILGK